MYKEPSMSPALERLHKEAEELSDKIEKLTAFIESVKFHGLEVLAQDLLRAQLTTMQTYMQILLTRIKFWKDRYGRITDTNT